MGRGKNVGLRDFCHILTLLPPGASVFHKHMSSWYTVFYHLTCLCNNIYGLSALVGCWSSAFIRRIIYIVTLTVTFIPKIATLLDFVAAGAFVFPFRGHRNFNQIWETKHVALGDWPPTLTQMIYHTSSAKNRKGFPIRTRLNAELPYTDSNVFRRELYYLKCMFRRNLWFFSCFRLYLYVYVNL